MKNAPRSVLASGFALSILAGLAASILLVGAAWADPPQPLLPAPYATPSTANYPKAAPWPAGRLPAARGPFRVSLWAEGLNSARWLYELPNGDVLAAVGHSRARGQGRILLLRDANGDGRSEAPRIFLQNVSGNLNQPFGMALVGDHLYVANNDGLWRYPYVAGATSIAASSGVKALDLPVGGHWSRNVIASPDGRRLMITVGSATNVDLEKIDVLDSRRAAILEYTIATGQSRVFASGLRNPNGLGWNPVTRKLWTAVNERDGLGDDLVPDFVTSVERGGFYGWPYYYFGYPDPRKAAERPDLAARALVPDLAVGAHTSTLGLAFYTGTAFPPRYRNGMFIAQHGSWNRATPAGYRLAFVPFDANGAVAGPPQTVLFGFLGDRSDLTAFGRPVGVIMRRDGSLLVTDDAAGRIYRVTYRGRDETVPSLKGLMLIDAATDAPIYPLVDGAALDSAKLGTAQFSIAAAPGAPVGSVRFMLDGKTLGVDNAAPFTIAGDRRRGGGGVDYLPWTPPSGAHRLVVTPFSGNDAKGRRGPSLAVDFTRPD